MLLEELNYHYPPELVATEPSRPTRVAFMPSAGEPRELTVSGLLEEFFPGDLLVINESKVIPARVFSREEVEILFLRTQSANEWQVLFPAREFKIGDDIELPGGVTLTLLQKGLPQIARVSRELTPEYFAEHGEFALPPYIQEARAQRHNLASDEQWYQTAWAKNPGSVAAPTASLHFSEKDLEVLRAKGVNVAKLSLHVGAGTFLPVKTEKLEDHKMHAEEVEIPVETLRLIEQTKTAGGRVWALGTTVARSIEAWANGHFARQSDGSLKGETKLFITPDYSFKVVNGLLTNFHQPKSTLLSLVFAFAGTERTKEAYAWAIEHRFHLFSYGDLSAWIR
jgi:S-adenosylmethionine:tRNA ribosyltransferase-isomerase